MGCLFGLVTLPFKVIYWFFKIIWEIIELISHRHRRKHHRNIHSCVHSAISVTSKVSVDNAAERWIVFFSLFIPPLGLVAIWQSDTYSKLKKISLTVVVSVWTVIYALIVLFFATGGASSS